MATRETNIVGAWSRTVPRIRWNEILEPFSPLRYSPRVEVFQQGRVADSIYLVTSGLVKLLYVNSKGKEVIVGLRHTGHLLGASSVILGEQYSASAETATLCSLVRVPAIDFGRLLDSNPEFSKLVHRALAEEEMSHFNRLVEQISHSTYYRLVKLLHQIISTSRTAESRTNLQLSIPLKQWELAELLAVTPEHTSRVLRLLEDEGLVRRKNGILIVLDADKLASLLEREYWSKRRTDSWVGVQTDLVLDRT